MSGCSNILPISYDCSKTRINITDDQIWELRISKEDKFELSVIAIYFDIISASFDDKEINFEIKEKDNPHAEYKPVIYKLIKNEIHI